VAQGGETQGGAGRAVMARSTRGFGEVPSQEVRRMWEGLLIAASAGVLLAVFTSLGRWALQWIRKKRRSSPWWNACIRRRFWEVLPVPVECEMGDAGPYTLDNITFTKEIPVRIVPLRSCRTLTKPSSSPHARTCRRLTWKEYWQYLSHRTTK